MSMEKPRIFGVLKNDQWIRPYLRQYRGTLVIAFLLGLLTFFSAGGLMFTSGYLISRAAERPGNIMLIYIPVVLTRAFGIGKPVFKYVERLTNHNWVLRMTSFLRVKLFSLVVKDGIFFHGKYRLGTMLGTLTEDIGQIQNLYLRCIFPSVVAWLLYVIVVIWMGFFSIWLAAVLLVQLGILVFVLPLVSILVNRARQSNLKDMNIQLYQELTDHVMGAGDWIFANRINDCLKSNEDTLAKMSATDEILERYSRRRGLVMQVVFGVGLVCILIWAGSNFIGVQGGAANWIAAFTLCFFPILDAFAALPEAAQETNHYADSMKRLNNLSTQGSPQISTNDSSVLLTTNVTSVLKATNDYSVLKATNEYQDQAEMIESKTQIETIESETEEIVAPYYMKLERISFRYQKDSREIFKDFSLQIKPGEKIAVLGRSGVGKSTLLSLIRGDLQPQRGQVTLNNIPTFVFGDNITRYLGVIPQSPYVFHTTLLNNLRIGKKNAQEDEVCEALEKVGLTDLALRLPDGLHTVVDEAGLRFSGGERQRLALARILLMDPPIILLDEPTVGLDPLTEQKVLQAFFQNLADKTIIWITHHLQGVSMMDRVLFLKNGQVVMDGTPQELLESNRDFQRLNNIDQGGFL